VFKIKDNYEKLNIVIYMMKNMAPPLKPFFTCGTSGHKPGTSI
jgi:hypothetical protein